MNNNYFSVENLTVGYNKKPLIRDICLNIKKGEILTLIGPNGAGKTTILKSIIRELSPLGGTVLLNGSDIYGIKPLELAKQLSVVLTNRVSTELMTCEDVVSTGRYPYTGKFGLLSDEDIRKVREAMELVNITHLAKVDFSQISDGQKQRVMLARALAQEPEVLILDEPTSYLDIRYKLEFLSVVQHLARTEKLTVIMSLHEVDLAQRISDKIACVKGDRIERFGSHEEVFVSGYIEALYDLKSGNYDVLNGSIELERCNGEAEVFVICGCGSGTQFMRKLQRMGKPFAVGVLWENDLDYPAACALAVETVSVKPFEQIGDSTLSHAKKLIDSCKAVICALDEAKMTGIAADLKILTEYADKQGKLSYGI